ncbi:IDEAL domain-containing protein [Bacillus sp. FJAT-27251]|uniref:IDEAL domain-containing protein n=1 Tax=Bacillus sp. FJAT-27251 TaxID=1684142 RepID=UPI0006A76305|nr:IDEAL domain-containing protein [Bacillus sp. FJAT-27251]
MIGHYIAAGSFEQPINCLCPGGGHSGLLSLQQGDIIEVIDQRKYTIARGWHYLININNHWFVYISEKDLEECSRKGQLLSPVDMDLEANYLQFKINEALDGGNESAFHQLTGRLNDLYDLKESLGHFVKYLPV